MVAAPGSRGLAAQAPFAHCEALLREAPAARAAAKCVRAAAAKNPEELHDEAVDRLESWRATHPDDPWLPFYLGALEWTRRTDRVPDLYAEAAELFARRGEARHEVTARGARARFLMLYVGFEEAQEELDRMVPLVERTGDVATTLWVHIESARMSYLQRRIVDAHQRLHREDVVSQFRGTGAAELEEHYRDWLFLAAQVAYELGRPREARHQLRRWLEEFAREPDPASVTESSIRYLLAAFHVSSAPPTDAARKEALALLEQALVSARESDNASAEVQVLRMLGKLYPGSDGERYLRRCVERAQGVASDPSLLSLCQGALASHVASRDPEQARWRIGRAVERAEMAEDPWSRTFAELERLRVDWETLPRKRALERALATLDRLEQTLETGATDLEAQARLRAEWLDPGYWVAGRLLGGEGSVGRAADPQPEDLETTFEVVEHMRARALSEALRAAGGSDAEGRLPDLEAATLSRLERYLKPNEALLSYQVGSWRNLYGEFEGGVWLLVVTRGGTRVYRLPERTEIEPDAVALATMEDPEAVPFLLTRLHRRLLEPALAELSPSIRHLVIVPDGALHRLPFALLRPREPSTASLAARYEISLVPSASLWLHWRNREPGPFRSPVLVLADPAIDGMTTEARGGGESPATVRGGRVLGSLPFARREGREVVRRLGGGDLWMGDAASEQALKEVPLGPRYAVLHLAVHAVADEGRPERSAVFLAPGGGEDGRLTPAEVLALDLRDRLVVLAACETATGEVLRGEGPLSLARYFFEAGARAVVAGLWDLPDAEAADLFSRFYRHLGAGGTVSGALAAAQREHLAAGGSARTWGGLAVLGDGTARPFPEGRTPGAPGRAPGSAPWLVLVTAVLAAGAILVLLARRRRGGEPLTGAGS